MDRKTVFTSLDKQDLQALIEAYNLLLIEKTDKFRREEYAKEAYHDEVRPIVKKLAKFISEWEEIHEKELLDAAIAEARPA